MKSHQVFLLELIQRLVRSFPLWIQRKESVRSFDNDAEDNGQVGRNQKPCGDLTCEFIPVGIFFHPPLVLILNIMIFPADRMLPVMPVSLLSFACHQEIGGYLKDQQYEGN
jgi:hypothetical protein